MLSTNAVTIGTVLLLLVLAFFILPAYEHFKDAIPNAPPKPEWLKSENKEGFLSDQSYSGDYLPSWFSRVEPFETGDEKPRSNVTVIPPVSVPPVNTSSTLGTTPGGTADMLSSSRPMPSTHLTVPAPSFSLGSAAGGMGSEYIKKSSLVPCVQTSSPSRAQNQFNSARAPQNQFNSAPSSVVPGDQDSSINALSRAQNQFNIMKPMGDAFPREQNDVSGFLNSFSAFTR